MRAILDTHAFLWGIAGDNRMSQNARKLFVGPSNLYLSNASIWEILIKVQTGKLHVPRPAGPWILSKLAENRIEALPVALAHLLAFEQLPLHHRDPFDRILIAQSMEEKIPLMTDDPLFGRYPVELIW
ncbi:MAG TPA: type II toxin-antitoxin system VapC family toxin [Terriglobales bacterium]